MKWINGKKTIIGTIAAGVLGVVFSIDAMMHDDAATADVTELGWLTWQQYSAIGSAILAATGAAWRHAFAKGR